MSDNLLKEYIEELVELHKDPKMQKILSVTAGSTSLRAMKQLRSEAGKISKNVLLAWLEKSGIEFDPKMLEYVQNVFPDITKKYGFRRGSMILLAMLDKNYGNKKS